MVVARATPEMLSLPEEAARRRVAGYNEQERGWVPRGVGESWLGLMQEVGVCGCCLAVCLSVAAAGVGLAHAEVTLSEDGALATKNVFGGTYRTAASKVVMRSGRHYAQLTVMVHTCRRVHVLRRP